jgi:hypothetical protein
MKAVTRSGTQTLVASTMSGGNGRPINSGHLTGTPLGHSTAGTVNGLAGGDEDDSQGYKEALAQLEVLRQCRLDEEDKWRAAADKVVAEFLVPLQEQWRELERARRSIVGQKRAVTKRAKALAARPRRTPVATNGHHTPPPSGHTPGTRKSSSPPG